VKQTKSLQKEEIEGQEWAEDTAEYTEDGIRIDPFNMDQELEQGYMVPDADLLDPLMNQAIMFGQWINLDIMILGCLE
jgi:hypothetical protein